ncbi:FAD-dependent oxidoreductase [Tsukamurella tyrosinosolvens]|uniref:FAD-dependent oxidoreductase n=1 Tax=Tsukamurella tyrosinosolvens TaxID=57704 RepID=UPI000CA38BC6|nr:FAD-dependent oxidoreductase [Tsukamurella tyrosinosolvens]AUN43176.1 hypothetical protein ASU32_19200 [Tsukamurella tyrosinosolvens]
MDNRDILIVGAGIAGTTLAYWLEQYGFRITVVERAPTMRSGGHFVDVRGTGREVIDRMGVTERVRAACLGTRDMSFVDARGKPVANLTSAAFGPSGGPVAEWSLRRTELVSVLHDAVRSDVEVVFDDAVTGLCDDVDGVTVTFAKGGSRRFDVLVGADGVHSSVREMLFGPEARWIRDLDAFIALLSVDLDVDLGGQQLMHTVPGGSGRSGRTAGLRPLPEPGRALAGFFFRAPQLRVGRRDIAAQRRVVAETFGDVAWHVPAIVPQIPDASDFYFDRVEQVHLDTWSRGRTALLGDAAFCASPMSGIGTSLALVGAYVLAGELLAADGDHHSAFAAYEDRMRPFVDRAQRFARTAGDGGLMPRSPAQMWLRNQMIKATPYVPKALMGRGLEQIADTVSIADCPHAQRRS